MMDFGRDEPQREGVRGGLEQFRWDSVKGQVLRDRECYLGQSVRIGMQGKFGRFQTFDWWQKKNNLTEAEIEQTKLRNLERQMQAEALGLKPKKALLNPSAALADLSVEPSSSRRKRKRRKRNGSLDSREGHESKRRRHHLYTKESKSRRSVSLSPESKSKRLQEADDHCRRSVSSSPPESKIRSKQEINCHRRRSESPSSPPQSKRRLLQESDHYRRLSVSPSPHIVARRRSLQETDDHRRRSMSPSPPESKRRLLPESDHHRRRSISPSPPESKPRLRQEINYHRRRSVSRSSLTVSERRLLKETNDRRRRSVSPSPPQSELRLLRENDGCRLSNSPQHCRRRIISSRARFSFTPPCSRSLRRGLSPSAQRFSPPSLPYRRFRDSSPSEDRRSRQIIERSRSSRQDKSER